MYTLDIQDENIFDYYNFYHIKCIGKCTKGYDMHDYKAKFFLTNHNKKYEAFEELHGLDDIRVTLKQVDDFTIPGEDWDYYEWTGITRDAMKKQIIDELGGMVYNKDGFVIFKQMYYENGRACMGGIDDIYVYEQIDYERFKNILEHAELEFDISNGSISDIGEER